MHAQRESSKRCEQEVIEPVTQMQPLVSIVIVNYNGAHLLRACLQSVRSQSYRPIEIIVVDNASSDTSKEMLSSEFPEVRVIALECNSGYAEGNNVGVQAASADCIVLLNNDTTVEEGWLLPLIQAVETSGIAVVTSKVITDGIPESFYEMNGTINFLGQNIMREFSDLSEVFYAGGTSLMFKKSLVGIPFLNEYFLYQEDVFLSWRWRLRGYRAAMSQRSVVQHKGNATTKRSASELVTYYQERNRILNLFLFYERRTLIKLVPFLVFDACLKILFAAFSPSKSLRGVLKAYWWLCAHHKEILLMRSREQAARIVADEEVMKKMSHEVFDDARSAPLVRPLNSLARSYARLVGLKYHSRESAH